METDLKNEIRVLSKLIVRLESFSDHSDDLGELMKLTDQVGKAGIRKANLMKVQKDLHLAGDDLDEMLRQALKKVTREMGITK